MKRKISGNAFYWHCRNALPAQKLYFVLVKPEVAFRMATINKNRDIASIIDAISSSTLSNTSECGKIVAQFGQLSKRPNVYRALGRPLILGKSSSCTLDTQYSGGVVRHPLPPAVKAGAWDTLLRACLAKAGGVFQAPPLLSVMAAAVAYAFKYGVRPPVPFKPELILRFESRHASALLSIVKGVLLWK